MMLTKNQRMVEGQNRSFLMRLNTHPGYFTGKMTMLPFDDFVILLRREIKWPVCDVPVSRCYALAMLRILQHYEGAACQNYVSA
jgi:hypothetical protein